jgi:hypothetical protein
MTIPSGILKRCNEIIDFHNHIVPSIRVPNSHETEAHNESNAYRNNIPINENQTQANHTIYESQYEVIISQTTTKNRELSFGMESPQRSKTIDKNHLKLVGPCFLNMINPFQINRKQMKLLTSTLENNEFGNLNHVF